jgi:hypothetical protein
MENSSQNDEGQPSVAAALSPVASSSANAPALAPSVIPPPPPRRTGGIPASKVTPSITPDATVSQLPVAVPPPPPRRAGGAGVQAPIPAPQPEGTPAADALTSSIDSIAALAPPPPPRRNPTSTSKESSRPGPFKSAYTCFVPRLVPVAELVSQLLLERAWWMPLELGSMDVGGTSVQPPDFMWYTRKMDSEAAASRDFSVLSMCVDS